MYNELGRSGMLIGEVITDSPYRTVLVLGHVGAVHRFDLATSVTSSCITEFQWSIYDRLLSEHNRLLVGA